MAYGLKAFREVQISNEEGTPGSAEAAVEVLNCILSAPGGDKVIHFPEEDRNSLSKNLANDFIKGREASISIEGDLNHRHAVWMFCNAIRGNITPTQPKATLEPLSYLWTIEPGLTTANTADITNGIDTFTIEWGDNIQGYEGEFAFAVSLEISGAPNEPVQFKWEVTVRQITESTVTAALTASSVQYFPSNLVKFYVDTSVATWGDTVKAGMLQAFTWKLDTMFTPRYGADGTLYFTGMNEDKKKVDLELTYYRDAVSELEKDKYDARTTTFLRIEILGQTEMDSGQTNYPYIHLDGAYRYTDWPELDDSDGTTIESVTAESVYDSTGSKEYSVKIFTNLDAYPA